MLNSLKSRNVNSRQFKSELSKATLRFQKAGCRLVRMNGRRGPEYFLIPGPHIPEDIAIALISRPDVIGAHDTLFPHLEKTFRIIASTSSAAA